MKEHDAERTVRLDDAAVALSGHGAFLSRIGHMPGMLHESLRRLGLEKLIEKAASDIPDARDRLDYVARLSEQSAQNKPSGTEVVANQAQVDDLPGSLGF